MAGNDIALPALLAEIAEVVGQSAAVAIASAYGGTVKEFPSPEFLEKNPKRYADTWLVQTVGHDKALAICKELFPIGGRAEIPLGSSAIRQAYVMQNSGSVSVADMAMFLGMTERGVRMIRSKLRNKGLIP